MNDQPITEDDLNGYVDDAFDPVRRVRVEAYLAAHTEVAERVTGYVKQRDLLCAAFAPIFVEPVPPELNPASIVEARRRPGLTRGRGALAAALLLCGGAAGGWALRGALGPSTEGVAALAQEAVDSYAVYVPDQERPVELRAAERATLVDLASSRLRRPVAVPDLAASGYRFMGGASSSRRTARPHCTGTTTTGARGSCCSCASWPSSGTRPSPSTRWEP